MHAIVELAIVFHEVDDVEDVLAILSSVADFEIEPLCIALGPVVWLQNQLVFVAVDLYGFSEVAAFESAFKLQNVVFNFLSFVDHRKLVRKMEIVKSFEKPIF